MCVSRYRPGWQVRHVTRSAEVFVHCPIRRIYTAHERDVIGDSVWEVREGHVLATEGVFLVLKNDTATI